MSLGQVRQLVLHAQAAVHIRSEECADTAYAAFATAACLGSVPENDHGNEARFLIRNHHKAAGKTGNVLQPRLNRGWKKQRRADSLFWFGDEFKAEDGESSDRVGDWRFDSESSVGNIAERDDVLLRTVVLASWT